MEITVVRNAEPYVVKFNCFVPEYGRDVFEVCRAEGRSENTPLTLMLVAFGSEKAYMRDVN